MSTTTHTRFDVILLGTNIGSGLLGAILAKHGLSVLLIDTPTDPSQLTADSTVPYTTAVFELLAARFDIPEIGAFAHFTDLPPHIRRACGTKKSLTFLYHRPHQQQNPHEAVQFNVPGEHNEWHLHPPTVNEHARTIAIRYGTAVLTDRPHATAAEIDDDLVTITATDGHRYQAHLLVDLSGAELPGIPHAPQPATDQLHLHGRTLTTRMRGVKPIETVIDTSRYRRMTPMSLGTVHHLIAGGWIQIVDFRNHPQSVNDECQITIGINHTTPLPANAADAFTALISQYPDIATQFATATPTVAWVDHQPGQRITTCTHGKRWFAMGPAAYRIDDFLSRDLTMTAELIHALAPALIQAIRQPTSAEAILQQIATFQQQLLTYNDHMLAAARTACTDFQLWNAYSRVWLLWQITAHLFVKKATTQALTSPSWAPVERRDLGAIWFEVPHALRHLLDQFFHRFSQVESGHLTPTAAAHATFASLRQATCVPPLYAFADPTARCYRFSHTRRLLMLAWALTIAPPEFKHLLTRANVTGHREA